LSLFNARTVTQALLELLVLCGDLPVVVRIAAMIGRPVAGILAAALYVAC
jgi:hypothetical protein